MQQVSLSPLIDAKPVRLGKCNNMDCVMSQFAGSALINRPVDEVWKFISDPQNAPLWGRGVSDIVVTSKGTVGLGTALRLRMSRSKMEARIIEYEPAKTLTLEFIAGPVKGSKLSYSVEPVENKTRLTRDLEMRLSGMWRLMQPILARREIRDRELAINNVRRILEAQGTAPEM